MGRPLNKKYFGNRNIGTTGTSDNGIGGEGIASVTFSDAGSWLAVSGTPFSGLALPAPTLPGGVQATWTIYYGLYAVTTGAGKAGLNVGDTYTYPAYPGSVITVASTSDTNATFTVTTEGSSTTLPTDTQTVSITKLTGSGASSFTVDVFSHIVDTTINEKGSGYTGAETFTTTRTNSSTGGIPAGTIVLTTDSGSYGNSGNDGSNMNADNQENAIVMYANVGNGAGPVDIIKQVSGRRYKVTDGTDTGIVELGTDSSPESGEAYIVATATGGTYYVTKLTAHRATLVAKTGDEALDGTSAPWTFGSASASVVSIENA